MSVRRLLRVALPAILLGAPASATVPADEGLAHVRAPVASTPIDSLPYRIHRSGPYHLTRNLVAKKPEDGIVVLADGVTLDLKGFAMYGDGIGRRAIYGTESWRKVRDGTLEGWAAAIVGNPSRARIEGDHVASVVDVFQGPGISLTGTNNLVVGNSINTLMDLAEGNAYGPVVDLGGGGDLGVVADGTNPWANFWMHRNTRT